MSRARALRESPDFNMNMYDLMSIFVPEKKSKYVETFLRIMKNTQNIDGHVGEIKKELHEQFGVSIELLNNFTNLQLIMGHNFIASMFNDEDLKTFQRFCEFNERNLIAENDLSTYRTFQQITDSVEVAQLILDEKEMEKQIKVVLKSDEWMIIRPLTFLSSRKYGSNTKWCTTSEKDDTYFKKYAGNGVLCYVINRKTNHKVASFFSLKSDSKEFSFWDVKDNRIDSLEAGLPTELLNIIVNENKAKKSNLELLTDDHSFGFGGAMKKLQSRISGAISREMGETNTVEGDVPSQMFRTSDLESMLPHIENDMREQTNERFTRGPISNIAMDSGMITGMLGLDADEHDEYGGLSDDNDTMENGLNF